MNVKQEMNDVLNRAECLYDSVQVGIAMDQMADSITKKLGDKDPIILCVMVGAMVTVGHLLTRLSFPLTVDYVHATRYRGKLKGKDLHWLVKPRSTFKDRIVLVVDDIMDGGLTLESIVNHCNKAGAEKIYTAVLVNKLRKREDNVSVEPDFVGVQTEDRYLFGYGLDYKEYHRNAPGIFAVSSEDCE